MASCMLIPSANSADGGGRLSHADQELAGVWRYACRQLVWLDVTSHNGDDATAVPSCDASSLWLSWILVPFVT